MTEIKIIKIKMTEIKDYESELERLYESNMLSEVEKEIVDHCKICTFDSGKVESTEQSSREMKSKELKQEILSPGSCALKIFLNQNYSLHYSNSSSSWTCSNNGERIEVPTMLMKNLFPDKCYYNINILHFLFLQCTRYKYTKEAQLHQGIVSKLLRKFSLRHKIDFDVNRKLICSRSGDDTKLIHLLTVFNPTFALELLIEYGVDVNELDMFYHTPLHLCNPNPYNYEPHINFTAARILLRANANIYKKYHFSWDYDDYNIYQHNLRVTKYRENGYVAENIRKFLRMLRGINRLHNVAARIIYRSRKRKIIATLKSLPEFYSVYVFYFAAQIIADCLVPLLVIYL